MLGFKRRTEAVAPVVLSLADARAQLEAAQRELAAAPWDGQRREAYRLAHNALVDLTAGPQAQPLTAH